MDSLLHDLRYVTRQLSRYRSFSITAFLTLALVIGANAIFAVISSVLLAVASALAGLGLSWTGVRALFVLGVDQLRRTAGVTAILAWAVIVPPLVAAQGSDPPERDSQETAFVNVSVLTMDDETLLHNQTVVVRQGRIATLAPAGSLTPADDALIVDGAGRTLLPGLVDAHVHLDSWVGARPDFGDAPLFLAHGVTSVINLRGVATTLEWKRRIAEGTLLAPNLYTSGEFVNEPRVNTPEEAAAEVQAQADAGYDLIKFREVIDFETGQVLTTSGLAEDALLALHEAARQAGLPVVGHAPYRVGLDGMLAAGHSLAHTNELANVYFMPPLDLGSGMVMLARWSFLALLLLVVIGALVTLVGWLRRDSAAPEPARPAGILVPAATALAVAVAAAVLWILVVPPGRLFGNLALLLVLSALVAVLVGLALVMIRRVMVAARSPEGSRSQTILAVATALAALALVAGVALPTAFAWRGSDWAVHRVARRCADAGIWVQSTLVLYETGQAARDGYRIEEQKQLPAFQYLPAELQESWGRIPGLFPPWMGRIWRRHPVFNRELLGALHRQGVPIMAGTDALGVPFVIPGHSLHRELALLDECGLTPYQVLWTATVGPARFLGLGPEFGTIAEGKRADLILVEGDPTSNLACLARPEGVMVRGVWLPRAQLDRMLEDLRPTADPEPVP